MKEEQRDRGMPRTYDRVYESEQTVGNYDDRRFGGPGGRYVFDRELTVVKHFLADVDGTILDLPCGTGLLSSQLKEADCTVISADASGLMSAVTARRSTSESVVLCDAFALPFPDDSIDATVTIRLFQHYPGESIEKILSELRRVVAPSGKIIFDTFRWSPRNTPFFSDGVYTYAPDEIEAVISRVDLEPVANRSMFLVSPIVYRKCPSPLVSALDRIERSLPEKFLVRTIWCCRVR